MVVELEQALAEIDSQPSAPKEMNLSDDDSSDDSDDSDHNHNDSDSDDDDESSSIFPPVFSFINTLAFIGFCAGASCYFGAFG